MRSQPVCVPSDNEDYNPTECGKASAAYLANLVPSNTSASCPSTSVIHSFLLRSCLPEETIAFAACLLDSLSLQFARLWRESCRNQLRTSPLKSEVIPLSALFLANSFLSDFEAGAIFWSRRVSQSKFTAQEIILTARCALIDIDFRLHSFTPAIIQETLASIDHWKRFSATNLRYETSTQSTEVTPEGIESVSAMQRAKKDFRYGRKSPSRSQTGLPTPEQSPL